MKGPMMRLSRTVGYALVALAELAAAPQGGMLTCRQMASSAKLPERFLLQILRQLVTGGLLSSSRGVGGGYRLARSPGEISVCDVLEVIEGPIGFDIELDQGDGEDAATPLATIRDAIRDTLQNITLAHVALRRESAPQWQDARPRPSPDRRASMAARSA